MQALKYDTLGNIRYRIDRRGKLYMDGRKIRRSKNEFYYEVTTSINGNYWKFNDNKYTTRKLAMEYIKSLQ